VWLVVLVLAPTPNQLQYGAVSYMGTSKLCDGGWGTVTHLSAWRGLPFRGRVVSSSMRSTGLNVIYGRTKS